MALHVRIFCHDHRDVVVLSGFTAESADSIEYRIQNAFRFQLCALSDDIPQTPLAEQLPGIAVSFEYSVRAKNQDLPGLEGTSLISVLCILHYAERQSLASQTFEAIRIWIKEKHRIVAGVNPRQPMDPILDDKKKQRHELGGIRGVGGAMEQLTTDYTFVQEMIDMGEVTPGGAKHHPLRNVLTRAIGTQERLDEVDVFSFVAKSGDRFLLCSDGLTDMVSGEAIASILNGGKDLESTSRELMHAAIQNGGKDNITLVTIDVKGA